MFDTDQFDFNAPGTQGSVDPYARAENPNTYVPQGDDLYGENGNDWIDWDAYLPRFDPDAETRVSKEVEDAMSSGTVLDADFFG